MGVPKFFRYISERYPCLSEIVKDYQIPGFDNLYLDMNGIIHTCSHPDDNDTSFRITEETIFRNIFSYIEFLFRMIKPQKTFFLAVDGVAPRAKMNQQRGRRFRSAKYVEKQEIEAKLKNIILPNTARFDSNCITPGTIFMTKLQEQLKYFISHKTTTDKLWQKCDIILSGHETPGEGEHKIMDYIRYARSQPGYDPNTRHCLYGLDADLIILGLCTHEPHFSLLREEVKFGKKSGHKLSSENTFYLLHLSLMREYLREEFKPVEDKLSFEYDLESIIDDWVLLGFLVGNDFIPHLPNLHINHGALQLLYKIYMDVLPLLDGYLNGSGTINLRRFEKFMKALTEIDYTHFEDTYDDLQYFKSKTGRSPNSNQRKNALEPWEMDEVVEELLDFVESENEVINTDLAALIKDTSDFAIDDPSVPCLSELSKIFLTDNSDKEERDMQIELEFQLHKKNYYETKIHITNLTSDTLLDLSYEYIKALQWILNYYYNGVCSWSWFYPFHYSPYISDIKGYLNMELNFDLAQPFLPYEQLLAVLPPGSKNSLPEPFHALMTDADSPIKDFYPDDFETDLNNKQQEWEAVVLLPFIDEKRLIDAMSLPLTQLSTEERKRNTHGPMLLYRYTDESLGPYYPTEYFSTIHANHATCTPLNREAFHVSYHNLVKGVFKKTAQGIYYTGFPTTKHLEYKSILLKKKVRVFDQPSRDYNMILSIVPPSEDNESKICDIAGEFLGKTIFVRWPHLIEAKVVGVSNTEYRYDISSDGNGYNVIEKCDSVQANFQTEKCIIETFYMERRGIDVGATSFLIHVRELVGRRYEFISDGKVRVNLTKEYAAAICSYPLQTIVKDIDVYDEHRSNYQELDSLFQGGAMCFMLGQPHYGATGKIIHCQETLGKGRIKVQMQVAKDPNFAPLHHLNNSRLNDYYSHYSAATRLVLSNAVLARITGTVLVGRGAAKHQTFEEASKVNVGLNLKNVRKSMCIPGYIKNVDSKWYYSERCLQLIDSYRNEFIALFKFLNNSTSNQLPLEIDIFPEDKGDGTTLKKIKEWISKQPYSALEWQHCDSKCLETEVVQELENTISLYSDNVQHTQIKMTVKPHCLHIFGLTSGNVSADKATTFELFDRVVNVRECYTVPLGYAGTVMAVHKMSNESFTYEKTAKILVDVLYDKPFAGGLSLNGCSTNRGFRMSANDLINKSHGDRQLDLHLQKKTPNYPVYNPVPSEGIAQNSAFVTWNNSFCSNYLNNYYKNSTYSNDYSTQSSNKPIETIQQQHMRNFNTPHQTVAYNSNNIPYHVHPPDLSKTQSDYQDQSKNNCSPKQSNTGQDVTATDSPRKEFESNEHAVQHSSPSKSPMKLVQRQIKPPEEPHKAKDEVVIDKKRTASKQIGTDMLRNLLQINEKENQKFNDRLSEASDSNSVDNFFRMAQSSHSIKPTRNEPTLSVNEPSTQSKDFPSAQLLLFFVAHGMGCPIYTYSRLNGGHKAKVQIPTNRGSNMVVVSSLCGSQNAATEDVAAQTLQQLKTMDLSIFMPEIPQIPNPPMQWRVDSIRPTSSNQENNSRRHMHEERSQRKSEPIKRSDIPAPKAYQSKLSAASVPFVPLQVTRKHVGKASGSALMDKIVIQTAESSEPNSSNKDLSQMKLQSELHFQQVNISAEQDKPKVARQMRLAAKFSNMPT